MQTKVITTLAILIVTQATYGILSRGQITHDPIDQVLVTHEDCVVSIWTRGGSLKKELTFQYPVAELLEIGKNHISIELNNGRQITVHF